MPGRREDAIAVLPTSSLVTGPSSSTDNALVRFDGTTGKLIQDSGWTLSDGNLLTAGGEIDMGGFAFNMGSGDFRFAGSHVIFSGGAMIYDSGGSNVSISPNDRTLNTNSGAIAFEWDNSGEIKFHQTLSSFNANISLGNGDSIHWGSDILANPGSGLQFNGANVLTSGGGGDGTNLNLNSNTSYNYNNLFNLPMSSIGNWFTDMFSNGHSLHFDNSGDVIYDSSSILTIAPFARYLYDESQTGNVSWSSASSARSFFINQGGNTYALDVSGKIRNDNAIYDGSDKQAISITSRGLFAPDGSTQIADWASTSGLKINGIVWSYNGNSLVESGMPSEVGSATLLGVSAAQSATTLFTPVADGMYRISIVLQVVRAATVSSTLGGTTGVTLTYTSANSSVAQSIKPLLTDQTGAIVVPATGNTGNTTTTQSQGSAVIFAKTGVAVQYAIGYASAGGTTMQYTAKIVMEAL